jgi:hypothetical protein
MEHYWCFGFLTAWIASTEQTKEPPIFDHFGFSSLFGLTRTYRKLMKIVAQCLRRLDLQGGIERSSVA